jgi:hypothetical protein
VDMVTFCADRSVDNSQTEIRKNRFLLLIIIIIANYVFSMFTNGNFLYKVDSHMKANQESDLHYH